MYISFFCKFNFLKQLENAKQTWFITGINTTHNAKRKNQTCNFTSIDTANYTKVASNTVSNFQVVKVIWSY